MVSQHPYVVRVQERLLAYEAPQLVCFSLFPPCTELTSRRYYENEKGKDERGKEADSL